MFKISTIRKIRTLFPAVRGGRDNPNRPLGLAGFRDLERGISVCPGIQPAPTSLLTSFGVTP